MVAHMLRSGHVISVILCLIGGSIHAQDLTEDEILHRFEAQRDMYRATASGQKTRGLDLVTITPGGPAPERAAAEGETAVVYGNFQPEITVDLAIRFAFDSATIAPDQRPTLQTMCRAMHRSDVGLFQIIGHTDGMGSDAYNENLSRLRAEEVRRWLVQDCGIAASRLEARGLGKRFLADPADPASAANRRVEFQALS